MSNTGLAFTLAYAPAKLDAIEMTRSLLAKLESEPGVTSDPKLKHAVDLASKATPIERKLAEEKVADARRAAGGASGDSDNLGTHIGSAAYALLLAWHRAERIAYLRAAKPDHPVLAAEAAARVPEVERAWADLQALITSSGHPALAARRDRLVKYMKFAPKPDATTSTTFSKGAYAEMVDFIKTLDIQVGAFAKDLATAPVANPVGDRLGALGASQVKIHSRDAAEVTLDADTLMRSAKQLFAAAPITVVHLTGAKGKLGAVGAIPELARVATLDLSKQGLTDDDLEQLLASPHLRGLRVLNLTQNQITDAGVEAIARATAEKLPGLERLGIQLNKATDPADQMELVDETNRAPIEQDAGKALEAKYGHLAWLHPHG